MAQEAALGAQQPFKSFSVNVDNQPKTSAPEVGSAAIVVIQTWPSNAYYRPEVDRRTSGESANSHLHSACIIRLELISSSRCAMRAAIT